MAVVAALVGCGSGGGAGTASTDTPVTSTPPPPAPTTPTPTSTSPEEQPGGAGDETPISTQALFTGRGGDITPATIRVPPFIAVNVVLHSADGQNYGIEVAHHELNVDGSNPTATVKLSGLRAGKRYEVNVTGAPETLAIVANAEPGP